MVQHNLGSAHWRLRKCRGCSWCTFNLVNKAFCLWSLNFFIQAYIRLSLDHWYEGRVIVLAVKVSNGKAYLHEWLILFLSYHIRFYLLPPFKISTFLIYIFKSSSIAERLACKRAGNLALSSLFTFIYWFFASCYKIYVFLNYKKKNRFHLDFFFFFFKCIYRSVH